MITQFGDCLVETDQKPCPSLLSGTALMHSSLDTQCPARKRLCEGHPISKSLSKYEGDCTRLIAPGTKTKYLMEKL